MASSMAPPPPLHPSSATPTLLTSTRSLPSDGTGRAPQIHTYHCHCSALVLASSTPLSSLPTRAPHEPSTSAIIVPLPPPPRDPSRSPSSTSSGSSSSAAASFSSSEEDDDDQPGRSAAPRRERERRASAQRSKTKQKADARHYALLLHALLDRRAVIVRCAEGGFEKRWLWRCGRCRVVIGYGLDGVHFTAGSLAAAGGGGAEENLGGEGEGVQERRGRSGGRDERDGKEKVVYILPGGVVDTDDMMAGRWREEKETEFGGAGI